MAENVESYPLNLGERIRDVMLEKGIKSQALSDLTGIARTTLNRRLDNHWTPDTKKYEVEAIATALNISVPRLERKDTEESERILLHLINSGSHPHKALSMIREIDNGAFGYTEKMYYSLWKGVILSKIEGKEQDALEEIHRGIQFAKISKSLDNEVVAVNRLIVYYIEVRDYDKMCRLNKKYAELFKTNEKFYAKYLMNLGMCAYNEMDYDSAINHYQQARDITRNVGDDIQAIRIEHNIADIFFKKEDYKEAFNILKTIRNQMKNDSINMQVLFLKNYARSLMEIGLIDDAIKSVNDAIGLIKLHHLEPNEIEGKLSLYKSMLDNSSLYAETALTFKNLSKETLVRLNYFLAVYYSERGDYQKSVKFYSTVFEVAPFKIDKLHRI